MIDARQNFEAYRLGTLTARETICIAAAITAISFLFAWLLDVAFSQRQQISASSQQVLLVENSNPYYLYLDLRFSVYFSHDTYLKTFLHPSDFQQEIAAVSLTSMPSLSTLVLSSDPSTPTTVFSSAQRRPATAPPPSMQRPSTSEIGTQNSEKPEGPTDNKNAFQRFVAKLFGKLSSPSVKLASAATDDSQLNAVSITSRYDQRTAVYDISSRTVYMPDGTSSRRIQGLVTASMILTRLRALISVRHLLMSTLSKCEKGLSTACAPCALFRSTIKRPWEGQACSHIALCLDQMGSRMAVCLSKTMMPSYAPT